MGKFDIKALTAALEARDQRERALLLGIIVVLLVYGWVVLVQDRLGAEQASLENQISNVSAQVQAQLNRYEEIQSSYSRDPNAMARERLSQLQQETALVDQRIDALYGQLIPPTAMAEVLTSILQRETNLRLLGLENLQPEALITDNNISASAIVGRGEGEFQVYRHGIRLRLQGEYLETIRYLQSLEALNPNFFWESVSYTAGEYPNGSITLNIFTLSTQREWIGV